MSNDLNSLDVALDFEPTIEDTGARAYCLLKPGKYPFKVTGHTKAQHAGSANLPSCPKVIVACEVDGGEQGKAAIKYTFFMHGRCIGFLVDFFTAIGIMQPGGTLKIDWSQIAGATGLCETKHRQYEGESYNEIKRFLRAEQAPKQSAYAAPQDQGFTLGDF